MLRTLLHRAWLPLFVASAISASAQTPEWAQFANSPPGTTPRNDDVHFVDPLHGWVARATDGIYRTTNGGQTFEKVRPSTSPYPGTNLTAHFRSINFASATRGWAGNLGPGSYDATVTDTNLLFETFDGGTTWAPVAAINNSDMKGFCSIHVMDAQHIYGGGRVRGPAHFAWSTNGGTSWSITNLTAGGIMGGIMDVYFKNAQEGFLVGMDTNAYTTSCSGYRGTIARTVNGGLTWSNVVTTPVTCSYFWKMSWPSTNVGYVSLQQNDAYSSVIFYKTIDGGASWVSNLIPLVSFGASSFFLQGIGFVSETEGWMGGSPSVAAPFNFIHTTDGGLNWTVAGYTDTQQINRIRFSNSGFGYASGRRIHVFRVPLGVVTPPASQTVPVGADAVFTVVGKGVAPVTYQWRFQGTNIAAATAPSLSLNNVQAPNAGTYDVVVSDYSGSVTSSPATLTITGLPLAPTILAQPQSQVLNASTNVTFSVKAISTAPLTYQWFYSGTILAGATNASFTRTNAQPSVAGIYFVRVTNALGAATSSVAVLSFAYSNNFDSFIPPVTVTNVGTTNGFKFFFNAAAGPLDFKAIFGFDYAAVTYPTNIPSAPNSGGTTRGLYLTVNKDANGQISAVNLYPTNNVLAGNYALKFDVWMNWANLGSSTEHLLFGINHSGNITNRISLAPSDGLFFAIGADGNVSASATTLRDYSVFRGGTNGSPVLMTSANTTFGPAPSLGANFDNLDTGISALFPPKTIPGFGTSLAGSPGLGWVSVEVRQVNNLITCLLNGVAFAQYANTFAYTNGSIMIGYDDAFPSIGDTNSFVIIDNLRVEGISLSPVQIVAPTISGNNFSLSFATESYELYSVQSTTNLLSGAWTTVTTILGSGATTNIVLPLNSGTESYFRVSRP